MAAVFMTVCNSLDDIYIRDERYYELGGVYELE
jgi:hypothetical protein